MDVVSILFIVRLKALSYILLSYNLKLSLLMILKCFASST